MIKVYFVVLIGILSVSFASVVIKLTYDVPAVIMSTYRLVISTVILGSWSFVKGINIKPSSKKELFLAMLSGFFLSLHFISWIASIKFTSIPSSVVLVSTSPIFVSLLSYIIFKEKQDIFTIIAVFLSVLGSGLIAFSDSGGFGMAFDKKAFIGDLLALFGAFAVGVYFMVGAGLRKSMDTFQYISLVYGFSAVFTLIFAVLSGEQFFGYRKISYFYMFLLAVVPQLLGHTSFNWALKYLKANAVAISTLGEPVGASILAYIFFGQIIKPLQAVGMVLVLVSIAVAISRSSNS